MGNSLACPLQPRSGARAPHLLFLSRQRAGCEAQGDSCGNKQLRPSEAATLHGRQRSPCWGQQSQPGHTGITSEPREVPGTGCAWPEASSLLSPDPQLPRLATFPTSVGQLFPGWDWISFGPASAQGSPRLVAEGASCNKVKVMLNSVLTGSCHYSHCSSQHGPPPPTQRSSPKTSPPPPGGARETGNWQG